MNPWRTFKHSILLLILCWLGGQAAAQTDSIGCGALLDRLVQLRAYPDSIIDLLNPNIACWEQDYFKDEDKVRAYRLLTEAYLLQIPPDVESATVQWKNLLNIEPEYNLERENGSEELIRIARRFNNRPWRTHQVWVGGHAPLVIPSGLYTTGQRALLQQAQTLDITRTPLPSIQAGVGTWWNLNSLKDNWPRLIRWEVGVTLGYQYSRYRYEELLETTPLNTVNEDFALISFQENQQRAILGAHIRHHFDRRRYAYEAPRRRLALYVHAGFSAGLLLTARMNDLVRQSEVFFNENEVEITGREVGGNENVDAARNDLAIWAQGGIGVKYKMGDTYLALEASYHFGLTNVVNTDQRYSNAAVVYRFGYVDPDWSLHTISTTLSLWFPKYRPRLKYEFQP